MTIPETSKFNEYIGKTWRFEGYYHGVDTSHKNKKGVVYVLIKGIKEVGTGDVFRDHTHIELSPKLYERYFENVKHTTKVEFTARTYYYQKEHTQWQHYVRRAVGLIDMNEIKVFNKKEELDLEKEDNYKPKKFDRTKKVKTIGRLLQHIDAEAYRVVKYRYTDLTDKEELRNLIVDVVNTLVEHRGNEKYYNVYDFNIKDSSYKAVLSKIYPDYRLINSTNKKYPNYTNKGKNSKREVVYKNMEEAYNSQHLTSRGRMVLTIVHKTTGSIIKVLEVEKNSVSEFKEVLKMVLKYFDVEYTEELVKDIRFDKENTKKVIKKRNKSWEDKLLQELKGNK